MSDINAYTTAEIANLTPQSGDLVLNTDDDAVQLWNGSAWKVFSSDASPFTQQYALSFDGAGDYVDTNSTFQSTYESNHTISLWFKLNVTSGTQSLFGAWSGPTSQNSIYFDGSASIVHRYRVASSPKSTSYTPFTADTNWHHYAVTLEQSGSNLIAKAYLDGVYKNTTTTTNLTMSGFSTNLNAFIGARNGSTGYLNGKMDEVAIIGEALSDGGVSTGEQAQGNIAALYNGGVPTVLPVTAVAHYRMEEGSGDSVVNTANPGTADGTINGATFVSGAGNIPG